MIDLLQECQRLFGEADIVSKPITTSRGTSLAFEGATVLGFVIVYATPEQLIGQWSADVASLINDNQLGIRRAKDKAWNTYIVLLASATGTYGELIALSAVEEDLIGARKIARANIKNAEELRAALLPLLPIQSAPHLEAVDMTVEIRVRTTELPPRTVEAFLSEAPGSSVVQVLEEDE